MTGKKLFNENVFILSCENIFWLNIFLLMQKYILFVHEKDIFVC